jgi:hypothetical protein
MNAGTGAENSLRRGLCVAAIFLASCGLLWAQQAATATGQTPAQQTAAQSVEQKNPPEPYDPREFPHQIIALRRAEIITIGIFPFAFAVTTLGYNLYRYADNGFGQGFGASMTDGERIGVLGFSLGLSATLAVVDWLLGKEERKRSDR